ncbi:MAG: cytochrome c oxidase assembly protein [Acidimicrobiales bacterium]
MSPLADQHLAGAIMWAPGGAAYLAAALALLARWTAAPGEDDRPAATGPPRRRPRPSPSGRRGGPSAGA